MTLDILTSVTFAVALLMSMHIVQYIMQTCLFVVDTKDMVKQPPNKTIGITTCFMWGLFFFLMLQR